MFAIGINNQTELIGSDLPPNTYGAQIIEEFFNKKDSESIEHRMNVEVFKRLKHIEEKLIELCRLNNSLKLNEPKFRFLRHELYDGEVIFLDRINPIQMQILDISTLLKIFNPKNESLPYYFYLEDIIYKELLIHVKAILFNGFITISTLQKYVLKKLQENNLIDIQEDKVTATLKARKIFI
jgi:hypothetical protein